MESWINERSRLYWYDQYALNEQDSAFARYDPDRIAEEMASTGADIVALYATNQFGIAYYPSRIWPQHPGLKGRDYFGEVLARLREHGIKVIAYTNWLDSKHAGWNMIPMGAEDGPASREQPLASWAQPAEPDGRIQALAGGGWLCPCFNSPQRQQVVDIAREICERYHPDMFHLDMLMNHHVCVCKYCRPTLEKICGGAGITQEAVTTNWREYVDWRCESASSIISEVSAVVRENGVMTAHNAFTPLSVPAMLGLDETWLDAIDIYLSECFDAFLSPSSDLNATSVNIRLHRALGKPSWILRTSTPLHFGHWPITKAQWLVYASACKANGAKAFGPCGIGAYPDTTSAKRLLGNVKAGFDFYMADADLDEDATPDAKVALVFSWATRKYYGAGAHDNWLKEFMGWARLLIEEHIPYEIVAAERVTSAKDLAGYQLLALPNTANLGDTFCAAVRDYVRGGGSITATAETSLYDEKGKRRGDFALSDLFGATCEGGSERNFAIERPAEPEPACGVLQNIEPTGKVTARFRGVDPAGSVGGGRDPLPQAEAEGALVVENSFGNGRAQYIAFDVGRYYDTYGDAHIGEWMAELIGGVLPVRQFVLKAPRTVEANVWRQEQFDRTIVHLANRTVPWTMPTDPLHELELEMPLPCPDPKVACRGANIVYRIDGGKLVVSIGKLEAYAAITIEPS